GEIVLTYPVAQERLDVFQKVLRPYNIEVKAHKTVEETDLMLEMAAAGRGVCLLPGWLLKHCELALVGLPFAHKPLPKTLYLATRAEDSGLAYIQWLVEQAKQL
ncbi:MAG: LysR substrate-binding domain-containing protein, partial [Methylococcales bacterium]|nr:LysR substrate-binding domain-containing protein [Methylococcales bacterium]